LLQMDSSRESVKESMKENKYKITVFIPTYNRLDFLKRSVKSVLKQGDFVKILILDNASTDGTREWLEEVRKESPQIEIIVHKENIGAVGNFQFGFNSVQTEYLIPLASDDELLPGFLIQALAELENEEDCAAIVFRTEVRENGNIKVINPSYTFIGKILPELHLELWSIGHYFSWSSILWKTSIIQKEGIAQAMASFGLASDAWIQFLIFSKYPVIISDQHGAILNIHKDQATKTMGLHSFKDFAEMVSAMNKSIVNNYNISAERKYLIIKEIAKHWNRSIEWGLSISNAEISNEDLKEALDLYIRIIYPLCELEDFPFFGLLKNKRGN